MKFSVIPGLQSRKYFQVISSTDCFLNRRFPFKSGWGHHHSFKSFSHLLRSEICTIFTHHHSISRTFILRCRENHGKSGKFSILIQTKKINTDSKEHILRGTCEVF